MKSAYKTALTGELLIGAESIPGKETAFYAVNPATGEQLEPAYGGAGQADLDRACALASEAFDVYRETSLEDRARFLEAIAQAILDLDSDLIERAVAETSLPTGRIEGERGRTVGQLRLFANVVREGSWLDVRVDPALPDRKPLPRPDLRLRYVAIGPVAVFGASNFPLAFSVAGGDTASALAAGCPVIVKAHPAHPGTSELVGRAIQSAVEACGLPEGVFSLLFGTGNWLGGALVADPKIKAVGFTGSRTGGLALLQAAAARKEPIPVYAEMSSINPVVLLPAALTSRGENLGKAFVGSLTLGAGQFCTNPGLIVAIDSPGLENFISAATETLSSSAASTMLHAGIQKAYCSGVERLAANPKVKLVAQGQAGSGVTQGQAALFTTDAESFLADEALQQEVFGASSLIVRCSDLQTVQRILEHLEGQLTVTLHMDSDDTAAARSLLPTLERKAGRVIADGWPTGVEVSHAMVHGGPFPATSDSRSTSVGTLAIKRFLRPICYQDLPEALLPESVKDGNPLGVPRRVDGILNIR